MSRTHHAIYLHGFASSPASSKARRFAAELARYGVELSAPDFNLPEFETLTVTRMLDQTAKAIAAAPATPVALIGSSLGAFVALHAAARDAASARPVVDRLLLLAPALDLSRGPDGADVEQWRREGRLRVFHYADGRPRDVGFTLYEDAARFDAFSVNLTVPTLVFQGRRDASVDPAMVEQWARPRPNVDLRMLDDEHQLAASMDEIWRESERFFGLA